jgi:hypothetical protein
MFGTTVRVTYELCMVDVGGEKHFLLSWWIRAASLRAACTSAIQNCLAVLEVEQWNV